MKVNDPKSTMSSGSATEFREPGPWNKPAAYWFWYRIPTAQEVHDQIRQMREAGYGSFQIQARMSMPLSDYLSDEYLRMCTLAAQVAQNNDMMIGIYDEYNWLSGHAGGKTVAGHDELREQHLFHTVAKVGADDGGALAEISDIHAVDVDYLLEQGRQWVFEGGAPRWDQWHIVAAIAYRCDSNGDIDPHSVRDVTVDAVIVQSDDKHCVSRLRDQAFSTEAGAEQGENVAYMVAARCFTSRRMNCLDPAAARRFTEVGYEPYAQALGEALGTTVRYVFFDQPHACFFDWRQNQGTTASTLMYDHHCYETLADEFGEEWPLALLSWIADVGAGTASLRSRFYERYSRQAIDSFFGTIARWCHRHGLLLSGHEVLSHVSSWDPTSTIIADDPRTNFGLDYFGIDQWRDVTGVDARNDYPQLSAKFGDSVARAHGRSGCVVEQYFGRVVPGSHFASGWWELTLAQLRSQAMRHHALGMRQLLMHAFWLTDGSEPQKDNRGVVDDQAQMFVNPRFDFAPGVNYEPWFPYHRAFADESARVSVFLDGMEPLNQVAVMYPLRTDWSYGPSHEFGHRMAWWCEHLSREGIDYVIIDERDLAGARATDDGGLSLPDGRVFQALVLPGVQTLRDVASVRVIKAVLESGGLVCSSGALPTRLQCDDGIDMVKEIRWLTSHAGWHRYDDPNHWDEASALLRERLHGEWLVTDQSGVPGQLWMRQGMDEWGKQRVMLFNDADVTRRVVLHAAAEGVDLVEWHADSGEIDGPEHGGSCVTITLAPHQVRLFQCQAVGAAVPLPRTLLTGWTFHPCVSGQEELTSVDINPLHGWQEQGFETFGGVGQYSITVAFDERFDDRITSWQWHLSLPQVSGSVEVLVNGRTVARAPWSQGQIDLGHAFHAGANRIDLRVAASAANYYYAGTSQQGDGLAVCGLGAAPVLSASSGGVSAEDRLAAI